AASLRTTSVSPTVGRRRKTTTARSTEFGRRSSRRQTVLTVLVHCARRFAPSRSIRASVSGWWARKTSRSKRMARRIGRRLFLQGAGGAIVALPVLTSLLPRSYAGGTPVRKRFLAIMSCSGQISKHWYPTYTPPGYQLTDTVFAGQGNCPDPLCNQDGT